MNLTRCQRPRQATDQWLSAREIRPPLRRWAAERLVRADPGIWGAMVVRARELDSKNGAAVTRGVLDAIDTLPEPARKLILDSVRRLAPP